MNTGYWTREELKTRAKNVLRINYWPALLVSILLGIAVGGSSGGGNSNVNFRYSSGNDFSEFSEFIAERPEIIIGSIVVFVFIMLIVIAFRVFVGGPLEVSCQRFFVTSAIEPHTRLDELGYSFKNGRYLPIVKTMFMKNLYIFLWTLLFIIPGIIKAYAYMMVPYILTENPELTTDEAITKSVEMMKGEKWNAFVLGLSFIGWYLLGIIACCIGVVFVAPYPNSTKAQLYLVLKEKYNSAHNEY